MAIGYIPFASSPVSAEAGFLKEYLGLQVLLLRQTRLEQWPCGSRLPPLALLQQDVASLLACPWIVAEGPQGFLWACVLRSAGFEGGFTLLPYINPTGWHDIAAIATYNCFSSSADRVFLGSTAAAELYRSLGIAAEVGEPYGVDCSRFQPGRAVTAVLQELQILPGRILLYAGRVAADKNVYGFLRVALKAQLLFPDLRIVIAARSLESGYAAQIRRFLYPTYPVHLVVQPPPEQLAALYCAAEVFVTAATSFFETFGRAPVEALSSGTVTIAPRYSGFAETMKQPGGFLVDVCRDGDDVAVDEPAMLRAIYDRLSTTSPVNRQEIAEAARARFCRKQTIHLLDYLHTTPVTRATSCAAPQFALEQPAVWAIPLRSLAVMNAQTALAWLWREGQHMPDGDHHNQEFQRGVRRFLAAAVRGSGSTAPL